MGNVARFPKREVTMEDAARILCERIDRVAAKAETATEADREWYHAYLTGLEEALWVMGW